MPDKVLIFDTTLRDGEQSPGASMNQEEKLSIARLLEELRVDIIEAGFPIASKGDFNSVQAIASEIKDCQIAGLARAKHEDIETAWNAVKKAKKAIDIYNASLNSTSAYKFEPEFDILANGNGIGLSMRF